MKIQLNCYLYGFYCSNEKKTYYHIVSYIGTSVFFFLLTVINLIIDENYAILQLIRKTTQKLTIPCDLSY